MEIYAIKNREGYVLIESLQVGPDWCIKKFVGKDKRGWSYFETLGYSCVKVKITEI